MSHAVFFQCPCARPTLMNYDYGWGWETHRTCSTCQSSARQSTRRHRGGDSKKKRHSCTRSPRKHHARLQAHGICQQVDWQTHKRGQGTRRQVQSTRTQEVHAVQAPGQGTVCVGVDIPWHNQPPEKCNPQQWWNITLTSALGG